MEMIVMRNATSTIGLACLSLCLYAGCSQQPPSSQPPSPQPPSRPIPIVSGKAASGTIWEKPVETKAGSNTGQPIEAGSRVDIYEQFIIVTPPKGRSTLSLHGWYTNLSFEKN
jgi:hypothetical protein